MRKTLGILQLIFALLFAGVAAASMSEFGGEFLILAERSSLLWGFAGILLIASILALADAFRPRPWIPGRAISAFLGLFDLFIAAALCLVMKSLLLWVVDAVPAYELVALGLPFAGWAALLAAEGASALARAIGGTGRPSLLGWQPSLAFALLVAATALVFATWSPRWATGVERLPLFSAGLEPGRAYRIPSLIAVPNRSGGEALVAFAESRADPMLDWGDIAIVERRSMDGGKTWSQVARVAQAAAGHTAGNPCPVADRETGLLWLPYCEDNKRVFVMSSADAGLHWSASREIDGSLDLGLKGPDSPLDLEYGTGPGIGLQLASGRLAVPAYFLGPNGSRGAHVIWSDDHGATWKRGTDLGAGEEPQAFQRRDGTLVLNCRFRRGADRLVGESRDGGLTWEGPARLQNGLVDAETQAAILDPPDSSSFGGLVLFTNPGMAVRGHLTLRWSADEGRTWTGSREIYSGPSCYSSLCLTRGGDLLVFAEAGRFDYREGIVLVRIDRDWLSH